MTRGDAIELRHVVMPLVAPFRSAAGVHDVVEKVIVRWAGAGGDGWGECPVELGPGSVATVEEAWSQLRDGPRAGSTLSAPAAAALEAARLDAELREAGVSLADHLGARRDAVDAGVALGIAPSIDALLDDVGTRLEQGYRRLKLKIEPGWDVAPVAAVRRRVGREVKLQVDANGSYRVDDAPRLRELDAFELLLIEQPLPPDDFEGHAALAEKIATPICLDESIGSLADLERALDLGACSIVSVKPSRLGGVLAARDVHDRCRTRGIPVWCGGMLETGIGRAVNIALAALPGFTLPGDLSASDRYFTRDLTPPFALEDGQLRVPRRPGIGVEVLPDVLDDVTVATETVRRDA